METIYVPVRRYHRIDGWRGYSIPANAVAGGSDTGGWEDSPCRPETVLGEVKRLRREVLHPAGIKSRLRWGSTSNVFCGKRWLVVSSSDFGKAAPLVDAWMKENDASLRRLHDADLDQCKRILNDLG